MGTKWYILEEKRSVKEGGKIEHILYDKKDSYPREPTEGWVAQLKERLKAELKNKGLTAERLLSLDETQKAQVSREIAKALGIRGMEKQEDVCGFIQRMAENHLALRQ
jgi:glucose-6-phosphate-specific signal transduction histidine kinase